MNDERFDERFDIHRIHALAQECNVRPCTIAVCLVLLTPAQTIEYITRCHAAEQTKAAFTALLDEVRGTKA